MNVPRLVFDRSKVTLIAAGVVCLALVKGACLATGDAGPDRLADENAQAALALGLGALLWLGARALSARAIRASGAAAPPVGPGGIIGFIFLVALGGLPIGAVQVYLRARMPLEARAASVEARFAPQIERLVAIIRSQEMVSLLGKSAKDDQVLRAAPAIRCVIAWNRPKGSDSSSGIRIYGDLPPGIAGSSTHFPRRADAPGEVVTNYWTGAGPRRVEYERAVVAQGEHLRGFAIYIDLDAAEGMKTK